MSMGCSSRTSAGLGRLASQSASGLAVGSRLVGWRRYASFVFSTLCAYTSHTPTSHRKGTGDTIHVTFSERSSH